jgi:hypothetical protein
VYLIPLGNRRRRSRIMRTTARAHRSAAISVPAPSSSRMPPSSRTSTSLRWRPPTGARG